MAQCSPTMPRRVILAAYRGSGTALAVPPQRWCTVATRVACRPRSLRAASTKAASPVTTAGVPTRESAAPPPHTMIFTSDRRNFIRPMGVASILQLGAWALFLGNGGYTVLPGLTTALVSVASVGFPAAIAVYARHYVCELSLVKRSSAAAETLEICTHTFGGGYHVVEYPVADVENSAPVQDFRRFRIRNAIEMRGFYIVDTARGTVPPRAQVAFDALLAEATGSGSGGSRPPPNKSGRARARPARR
eukprot:COSAG05_NODE_1079_length_5951_cov_17.759911_4_plen_248_part_00